MRRSTQRKPARGRTYTDGSRSSSLPSTIELRVRSWTLFAIIDKARAGVIGLIGASAQNLSAEIACVPAHIRYYLERRVPRAPLGRSRER